MIFSKLFKKKKWLSSKVSERLAAVAELDKDELANKSILHELAFNDGDEKVRRATLDKLNDFALWWQAYKHDYSDNIKKNAERIIIESLTGLRDTNLDKQLKKQFIDQCNKIQLLERVVFDLNDETLTLNTIKRLDRDALTFKGITQSSLSDESKLSLLTTVDDINQLKKLAKKLDGELLVNVETRLEQLKLDAEKPVKLEKHARLLLAQLNALRDKSDFGLIADKQAEIETQWLDAVNDIDILVNDVKVELLEKHQKISNVLDKIQAPLKAQWLEQQQEQELEQEQKNNFAIITSELTTVESKITQSIADDTELEQAQLSKDINAITHKCNELKLKDTNRVELLKRAETIFNRANQIPQIKQAIVLAKNLLEQLQQLPVPEDLTSLNQAQVEFKQLKTQWQQNLKDVGIALPAVIANEYDTLLKQKSKAVNEFEKQQRQIFNQMRRKIPELEELIKQGKFNNAFGLYRKMTFWYADLNDYQKSQIDRSWEVLESEMEKLKELQMSFSNPKKQELLADIKKLAESPLVDPTEQAHRVRLLRSNWQTLGHAGDEQEVALNDEFNQYCETAFVPCREHYKELEDERQVNLDAKLLIITQLETLANNLKSSEVSSWKDLESVFVKLTKLWRETGLIDREKVTETNNRYQASLKPIKQAITKHHSTNEQDKLTLIKQAQELASQDMDLNQKSDKLKRLQAKWKTVGFAGKGTDQKLWNEFRAVNNPVFEQRDKDKEQEMSAATELFDTHMAMLSDLKFSIDDASEINDLRSIIDQAEQSLTQVKGVAKPQFEKLRRIVLSITKSADESISALRKQQAQQVYIDLFLAVEALIEGKPADLSSFKSSWQSAFNMNAKQDRHKVTLTMEIVAGLESPQEDKAKRNEAQMAMLSEKMEQGIEYNVQDLLESWLAAGIFTDKDIPLLSRIKPIFVS
jgi:hypothetical protein